MVKKAVDASQGQLLTNLQTLLDSNFKTFKSSIENTQKELSTTQISKSEENLFKRHGYEAQYRGNIKVMSNRNKVGAWTGTLKNHTKCLCPREDAGDLSREYVLRIPSVS